MQVLEALQHQREAILEPKIDGTEVSLTGEVNDQTKQAFLSGAAALLFPIDWPEPFGLVMIEAMACGTPVIAFRVAQCRKWLTTASRASSARAWRRWRMRSNGSRSSTGAGAGRHLKSGLRRIEWRAIMSPCMNGS